MKIVCVRCGKFFHPLKNGVVVEEGMPNGSVHRFRTANGWGPYKLWLADELQCPTCKTKIISGFALSPYAEHYRTDYDVLRKKAIESGLYRSFVEDCI